MVMKLKTFDVVKLKDDNNATILSIKKGKEYLAEIIDKNGITVDRKIITENEVSSIIYRNNKDKEIIKY